MTSRCVPALSLLLVLVGLLAACAPTPGGGGEQGAGVDRSDPAAVNAAWVAALRGNDREAAMALYTDASPDARVFNVANALDGITVYMSIVPGQKKWPGVFERVELRTVQEVGAGREAYSQWVFAKANLCYFAQLAQEKGQWVVIAWYSSNVDATKCDE